MQPLQYMQSMAVIPDNKLQCRRSKSDRVNLKELSLVAKKSLSAVVVSWKLACTCMAVPKYTSKVKLGRRQSPNILSEIIIPGENGCSGGKIPISHFPLSLTHSALVVWIYRVGLRDILSPPCPKMHRVGFSRDTPSCPPLLPPLPSPTLSHLACTGLLAGEEITQGLHLY